MMLMSVDGPSAVGFESDLVRACSENRSEYYEKRKPSVIVGQAGTQVSLVWGMAGQMLMEIAVGACCGP